MIIIAGDRIRELVRNRGPKWGPCGIRRFVNIFEPQDSTTHEKKTPASLFNQVNGPPGILCKLFQSIDTRAVRLRDGFSGLERISTLNEHHRWTAMEGNEKGAVI